MSENTVNSRGHWVNQTMNVVGNVADSLEDFYQGDEKFLRVIWGGSMN